MQGSSLVLDYQSKEFLEEAWRAIREGHTWSVAIAGVSAKILKRTRRLGKYFRDRENPRLTRWEQLTLLFRGLLIPSFWAMYFYATDKGMRATWSEREDSIVIQFCSSAYSTS